ncbi:MAG: hypothetical protein DHS20C17_32750 [Cyclobacteriaceae bacterium]|nr:MAG: hypothetical protein DHS20C17_32750 [Cyclobacteriaceae bacterium]
MVGLRDPDKPGLNQFGGLIVIKERSLVNKVLLVRYYIMIYFACGSNRLLNPMPNGSTHKYLPISKL